MTLNFVAGLFVWLAVGIPLAGFLLWILTAPFRAMRNAADRRREERMSFDEAHAEWLRNGPRW